MKRFQLVVAFEDCARTEMVDDLIAALGAIQIYIGIDDILSIDLFDNIKKEKIFSWCAD